MKIHNIRLHPANNSSSTHSFLIGSKLGEKPAEDPYCFGWEDFHLKTPEDKMRYLAATYWANLPRCLGHEDKCAIVNQLFGVKITQQIGVDHQSLICLPKTREGKIEKRFLGQLKDWILQENISIAGGNDNESNVYENEAKDSRLKKILDVGELRAREDSRGYWSLFNPRTGAKTRISFSDEVISNRSDVPELVDLLITNRCYRGCKFCYRDSGLDGLHGDYEAIQNVLRTLARLGTFEVAIGGGDPTSHPRFTQILEYASNQGLATGFTVYDMDWAQGYTGWVVDKFARSFAISSIQEADIDTLADWNKDHANGPRGTLNMVVGAYPWNLTYRVISYAREQGVPVMLLGWKDTGRGVGYAKKDCEFLLEKLAEDGYQSFLCDTQFIRDFQKEIDTLGVDKVFLENREGMFSCAIEVQQNKVRVAPSSFAETQGNWVETRAGARCRRPGFESAPWIEICDWIRSEYAKF